MEWGDTTVPDANRVAHSIIQFESYVFRGGLLVGLRARGTAVGAGHDVSL